MLKNQTINLKIVEKVALALEELNDDVIYIGGAVVSLYVTDEGAEQPRPTKDIDISVQVSSYSQMEILREKLATKKIYPALTEKVINRFTYEGILIDFIPYDHTPLGPTNRWLKPGFRKAVSVIVGSVKIKIMPVPLFLASKWEAFKIRGKDARMSPDFEDIIYIIDNNLNLVDEITEANNDVQRFMKEMSKEILSHPYSNEIIECHINPFTMTERRKIVQNKLEKMLKLQISK